MNAPALTDVAAEQSARKWRILAPPIALGLLLFGLIFQAEVLAAIRTWESSTAYNHCFLVIPIVLYLIWDRRDNLVGIQAIPSPGAALLALPLGVAWFAAERLGIMEGRQLIVVALLQVLFLSVLGFRLYRAVSGPLLYLFFLVPFGEFLTPKLQDVTTFFIRHGLDALGIPAYIDGYTIEIPQGTFFVAEACAGLRFLIASIAFGCLYALMMYRSLARRVLFIAASIVVPIIANGLRGLGIVCLGYLLNSAQAAAADHIIYGWVFFSLVIFMLIALGLPFRQDDRVASARSGAPDTLPPRLAPVLAAACSVVAISGLTPALAAGLNGFGSAPIEGAAVLRLGPGCDTQAGSVPSGPTQQVRVTCGDTAMDIAWQMFSPRSTAGPVMTARRRMVQAAETESHAEAWIDTPDGSPGPWRIMSSTDPVYVTAVAVWVDGQPVRPGIVIRARMAVQSLTGGHDRSMVVTITPVVDWAHVSFSHRDEIRTALQQFIRQRTELNDALAGLSRTP